MGAGRSRTTANGYYMTVAPLVASGKVLVGASGGERGIRGFVAALESRRWSGDLADLYGAGTRRAGERQLARRLVADRWGVDLGNGKLRPRAEPDLLGNGQPGTVDR